MIEIIEDEAKRKRYALVLRHVEAQEDELDVALEPVYILLYNLVIS